MLFRSPCAGSGTSEKCIRLENHTFSKIKYCAAPLFRFLNNRHSKEVRLTIDLSSNKAKFFKPQITKCLAGFLLIDKSLCWKRNDR